MDSTTSPTAPARRRPAPADLVVGAGVVAWYAMPDLVRNRTARGWLKAATVVAATALAVRLSDPAAATVGAMEPRRCAAVAQETSDSDTGVRGRASQALATADPRLVGAGLVAIAAGSVAVTVVVERTIFRAGESMRGRGWRSPHTAIGVTLAALSLAAASLDRD
jgi:hypothetical protein